MVDGWRAGWIPMVDDRNPEQGLLLHRPLASSAGYTMCGRLVSDPTMPQEPVVGSASAPR